MTSRIRIFDHFCKPLAELHGVPTTPRRWALNQWNKTEFSIGYNAMLAQSVQKFSEKNFQYGNLIHIDHIPARDWALTKKGQLPSWTGVILPDRSWENGIGQVTAYSAEAILAFRAMPHRRVSGTPAAVFKEILNHAHATAKNIIIQPGVIDDINITFPDDLRLNAYDEILDLIRFAQMDFDVTGSVNEKGNLELAANLYKRKGVTTSLVLDSSNTELQGPLLSEQGTPTNWVFGYSDANTQQDRIGPIEGKNKAAIDDYGPLQLNQVFQNKRDAGSVGRASQNRADISGRPRKIIKRIALDKGKTFDYIAVGNEAIVKDTRVGFNKNGGYGFELPGRLLSADYNDMSNKAVLNIEVLG